MYYTEYMNERISVLDELSKKKDNEGLKRQAQMLMKNPCFVIAHELFDALPIYQFHYN